MITNHQTEILDWVNPKKKNWGNYSNNGPISCSLEVDLDYPDEFHDFHNDYPLAHDKIKVTKELPDYQSEIEDHNFSIEKIKKIVPNLGNKKIHTPL